MAAEEETLEALLHRATNPLSKEDDMAAIQAFATRLDSKVECHQNAVRLIAHKIQSPIERESLQALRLLEHCADMCDKRFHCEIGKFRFLNEMIKLVSPKYLGNRTPVEVKQRVISIMFKWTLQLKQEPKIGEAYQMLKQQGVVTDDPVSSNSYSPSPRPRDTLFDEEQSQLLHRLLQSRNPDDLQAANRLIKTMVKEDEKRLERATKRSIEIETVRNNIKVLEEMLANFKVGSSSKEEIELMKELYQSCENLRPSLFRLASDVEEGDSALEDILKANDELSQTMTHYRKLFGHSVNDEKSSGDKNTPLSLLDLSSPIAEKQEDFKTSTELSLLDDQLLGLGLDDSASGKEQNWSSDKNSIQELGDIFSSSLSTRASTHVNSSVKNSLELLNCSPTPPMVLPQPLQCIKSDVPHDLIRTNEQNISTSKPPRGLEDLDKLGQTLLKQALPPTIQPGAEFPNHTFRVPDKIPMNQLPTKKTNSNPGSPALHRASFSSEPLSISSSPSRSPIHEVLPLNNLFVPLESVQPSTTPPLTLYERNGLNVVLHFGQNVPRPDVGVMVVTTLSKNSEPIKNVLFQSAVPKTMKVKLQPPSATSLPGHNPILPPAAITQVMLLANPSKEKVRLKYKVSYTVGNEAFTDVREIDGLPTS